MSWKAPNCRIGDDLINFKKLIGKLGAFFQFITNSLIAVGRDISSIAILFMVFAISTDVILRFGFNKASNWIIEISGYLLVMIIALGLSYTLREKGHINITLVYSRLPKRFKLWLASFNNIAFLGYTIILFLLCLHLFTESIRYKTISGTVMAFPIAPAQAAMPLGLFILGMLILCEIYISVKRALTITEGKTSVD